MSKRNANPEVMLKKFVETPNYFLTLRYIEEYDECSAYVWIEQKGGEELPIASDNLEGLVDELEEVITGLCELLEEAKNMKKKVNSTVFQSMKLGEKDQK